MPPLLANYLICQHCDTVHRADPLKSADVIVCSCCDAILVRSLKLNVNHALALCIAAAILLAIATLTPALTIEFGGIRTETNAWTAALSMEGGWIIGAALILALVTFLIPMLQIALLLWILAFACTARRAPAFRSVLVFLHWLRPWSMTEVFLLGALVAFVKLSTWVHVVPDTGLWALGGLTILLALLGRYEPHAWWNLEVNRT